MHDMDWMPDWMLWILLPWVFLHIVYDLKVGEDLRDESQGQFKPFAPYGFAQVQAEIKRRAGAGNPVALLIVWYDRLIVAGFVVGVVYALFVGVRSLGQ